jgi:hypothetical protein
MMLAVLSVTLKRLSPLLYTEKLETTPAFSDPRS